MNCTCPQLESLREQSDRLRDLGEDIKEYAELLFSQEEENPITQNAFAKRLRNIDQTNKNYHRNFMEACRIGYIIVKIGKRSLNSRTSYLIARIDGSQDRDVPGVTYHCASCDEDLFK